MNVKLDGLYHVIFSIFFYLDEEFIERGVRASTSSTKQWFLKREFKVQRSNTAQMWPLGSSDGTIPWQKVRTYF